MNLSDFVDEVKQEIGERLEEDEDLDPRLILQLNGLLLEVDEISVDTSEIVFKPRTVPGSL